MNAAVSDAEIAGALEAADQKVAQGAPFAEIADAYQEVAARFAPALEARGDWRGLELRRRVAEAILAAAKAAERPTPECEALLRAVFELGFSDLMTKALVIVGFSGYCHHHGDGLRGLRYLQPLVDEVEAEYECTAAEMWKSCLTDCRELLGRIHQRDE